jgi:MscS family membrane protein
MSRLGLSVFFCAIAAAQVPKAAPPAPVPSDIPTDLYGRDTPRGTVLGFLNAGRKNDFETAARYLNNTRLTGKAAADLAHDLFVVLDLRLPPRLNEISDNPQGSRSDLANPDTDLVGTITIDNEKTPIQVERVTRGKNSPVWLFSSKTLDAIPNVYDQVSAVPVERVVPAFLVETRIAHIALFQWLAALVGLPLLYALTALVAHVLGRQVGNLRRRVLKKPDLPDIHIMPVPVRLLLIAALISWALTRVGLSLIARQVWSTIAWILVVTALVWLFIILGGVVESRIRKRLERVQNTAAASILHLGRRVVDVLAIFVGVMVVLYRFGINPSAALAGLGIGGIAVAFAAQKTLENVIGGINITFDQVVGVGDFLKVGDTIGTVESIGLRSTRIRTLDRTMVSVPNGLISGVTLENISGRDKFWFHHTIGLRYETKAAQMRSVLDSVTSLLARRAEVERESVRVRFLAFGPSSLNIEIVAYIFANNDWAQFLTVQGELLLEIMEIVESAGAAIAFPSQTMYVENAATSRSNGAQALLNAAAPE